MREAVRGVLPALSGPARIEALSPEDRRAPAQQCNQHESLPQGLAVRLTGTINVTLTTNRLPHADIEGNFASLLICRNSWHTDLNPTPDSAGSRTALIRRADMAG